MELKKIMAAFAAGAGEMVDFASAADAPWAPVPASGKQGLFYIMSKPGVLSDAIHAPFPVLK